MVELKKARTYIDSAVTIYKVNGKEWTEEVAEATGDFLNTMRDSETYDNVSIISPKLKGKKDLVLFIETNNSR